MKDGKRRKLIAVLTAGLVIVGLVIVGGVAAYAYFTSTGSGSGTASVGTATNWDVDVTVGTDTLYPGHGSDGITVDVTNVGSGNQLLDQLVATIDAPTAPAGPACTADDFALSGGSWVISNGGKTATLSTLSQDLDPTDTYTENTLSVSMNNLPTNQDDCQGATVNLSVDAS